MMSGRHQLVNQLRRSFSAKTGQGGLAGTKITGVLRFYEKVGVEHVEDEQAQTTKYVVTLDGKAVKTPGRTPVQLPTKAMAFAVAQEWDAQSYDIRPATMPIMTLASTALDLAHNTTTDEIVDEMLHYFHTDTVCYQVTADQQDKLATHQQKTWSPVREWFAQTFDGEVDVSHGTINHLSHDEQLVKNVREYLHTVSPLLVSISPVHQFTDVCLQLNDFELVALRCMTKECKVRRLSCSMDG